MARLKPAKTVSGDHQPPLCSKTFHGFPVPRPNPKLLFLAFGWAAFLPSPFSMFLPFPKRDHQPLFTLFPPPVHLHLTKVPQSQEGFSHQQGHAVPPPSTPHATFSSLPLAEHVLRQRQLCTFLISPQRENWDSPGYQFGLSQSPAVSPGIRYFTSLHLSVLIC